MSKMADEIAWRRNWKPDFDMQPWKVINTTPTDKTYLVKFYFEESLCSYKIAITDYQNLWFESIDQTTFDIRAKVRLLFTLLRLVGTIDKVLY